MDNLVTPSNITFALGFIGMLFSIFVYFRSPQEDMEKKQAVSEKEVESRAGLLAQQVQWEKEANEKKFNEFGLRLDNSVAMAQNHIHTIDVKVDNLTSVVSEMKNGLTKLSTIIDERIPQK